MSAYEFNILINREGIQGEYGLPGEQPELFGPHPLAPDRLTLDTVEIMNRWLCFWDRIESSTIERRMELLDSSTLRVLGEQLWRLILDNDLGEELRKRVPRRGEPPLRLSIEFDDEAEAALRGLPWEFLYDRQNRWFLAAKTELLLTRYVSTRDDRVKVGLVGDQENVRALLVAALPRGDDFAVHREALELLAKALKDVPNLEVSPPIGTWDPDEIEAELRRTEYHIVHVVGICRGAPGRPKIYLGGSGDGFHDPEPFVNILTVNPTRPQLVILQLCDFIDGDATDNFERLAPALVRRKVPAVLALQYAARVDQADKVGLGKDFYRALVDGVPVGTAVQDGRHRLGEKLDWHFGMPVLYLQEDGALRSRIPQTVGKSTAGVALPGGQTIREALLDVVVGPMAPEGDVASLVDWVVDLDPDLDLAAAQALVRRRLLSRTSGTERWVYTEMLKALGRLGRDDGRA